MQLATGWDMALKLHWELDDKRCNMEGYAANQPNRDAEDLVVWNLIVWF